MSHNGKGTLNQFLLHLPTVCVLETRTVSVPHNLRCENRPANRSARRETGLEMHCCPPVDLLWVQITQSYPNRLRFSSLPCPQSDDDAVFIQKDSKNPKKKKSLLRPCLGSIKTRMPHRTRGCAVNSPHNRTRGKRTVWNFFFDFFFQRIDSDKKNTFFLRVFMKNVCYLCTLVLQIKYKQKCEDKI